MQVQYELLNEYKEIEHPTAVTLPVQESSKKHDAIDPELAMKIAELLISTGNTNDKK